MYILSHTIAFGSYELVWWNTSQMIRQDLSSSDGSCRYWCRIRGLIWLATAVSRTSVSKIHPPRPYIPARVIQSSGRIVAVPEGSSVPRNVSLPLYGGGRMVEVEGYGAEFTFNLSIYRDLCVEE